METDSVDKTCKDPYLTTTVAGGIDTPAIADLAKRVEESRMSRWESGDHPVGRSGWIIVDHDIRKPVDDPKFCAWKKVRHCDGKSVRVVVDCDQIDRQQLNSALIVDEMVMCANKDADCKDGPACEKTCRTLYGVPPSSESFEFRDREKGLDISCRRVEAGTIVPDTGDDVVPYGSLSYTCQVKGEFGDILNLLRDEVQGECAASTDAACTPAAALNPHEIWRRQQERQQAVGPQAGGPLWRDDPDVHLKSYMVHMYDADPDRPRGFSMSVEMAGMFAHNCKSEEKGEGCEVGLGFEAIGVEFGEFKPKPKHTS